MTQNNGVPAKDKKRWLRDHIVAAMEPFRDDVNSLYGVTDAELKIETEIGEWRFNWFKNRSLRIAVMGKPIWYCEVLFTGPSVMTKSSVDGRWLGGMHEFAIALFLEYKPGVSTDLFEDMTDEQGDAREGLLLYLRNQGIQRVRYPDATDGPDECDVMMSIRETGDEETYRDQRSIVNFDQAQPSRSDKGHLLTFRVNIVDVV